LLLSDVEFSIIICECSEYQQMRREKTAVEIIFDSNALITTCKFSIQGAPLLRLILKGCKIIIPKSVGDEVTRAEGHYPDAAVAARFISGGQLEVDEAEIPRETFLHDYSLGKGEKEAIYLYLKRKAQVDYLITDDKLVYIVCDRMSIPKLFLLDLIIEMVRRGMLEYELAKEIIELAKPRYSKGMISHSLAILEEVKEDVQGAGS
jgi:predicted nucleic acid-binding protein